MSASNSALISSTWAALRTWLPFLSRTRSEKSKRHQQRVPGESAVHDTASCAGHCTYSPGRIRAALSPLHLTVNLPLTSWTNHESYCACLVVVWWLLLLWCWVVATRLGRMCGALGDDVQGVQAQRTTREESPHHNHSAERLIEAPGLTHTHRLPA